MSESGTNPQAEPEPLVSALFITWRRFDLLKPTVESFLRNTDYPNLELVIADDGSEPEVQALIRTLPAHHFSLPPTHSGLGANNNNGLRLCTGKYILMIQDDWLCHGPSDYLSNAVAVFKANPEVGIINFAGANHPPDLNRRLKGSSEPCYVTPEPIVSHKEEFLYCDQPHIRSRAVVESIGYYLEDRDMEKCEIDYTRRWRDQKMFTTAVFPAYSMRVFSNEGYARGRSFRLTKFRSRVDLLLLPCARLLKENCKPLYRVGRASIRASVALIEKLGIVR